MTPAWIRFWGVEGHRALDANEVTTALREAGIELERENTGAPGAPGILVVDEVNDDLLADVRRCSHGGNQRVLALSAEGQHRSVCRERAWRLLEAGASDVVTWRPEAPPIREIAERLERWWSIDRLIESPAVRNNLIGRSRAWLALLREVVEVAHFGDASILITGESGTGKELVARLVHTLDQRPDKRELVVVDCTTVVPELAGSELFGHERGSYTGATAPRDGAFALADGGSLFLDEVGELPLPLQAQLLRVVQERTYKRVGGNAWQSSQFRLISATNRDLSADADLGHFRRDLYYRLATWVCRTPPLRERPEDILPLAEHFVARFRPQGACEMEASVRDYLLEREYPGNVRELRQVVQRMCARHVGNGPLTVGDVGLQERPTLPLVSDWRLGHLENGVRRALRQGAGMREIGRAAEDMAVQIAVGDEDGNLQRAARRLGVTDRALQLRRAEQRR